MVVVLLTTSNRNFAQKAGWCTPLQCYPRVVQFISLSYELYLAASFVAVQYELFLSSMSMSYLW